MSSWLAVNLFLPAHPRFRGVSKDQRHVILGVPLIGGDEESMFGNQRETVGEVCLGSPIYFSANLEENLRQKGRRSLLRCGPLSHPLNTLNAVLSFWAWTSDTLLGVSLKLFSPSISLLKRKGTNKWHQNTTPTCCPWNPSWQWYPWASPKALKRRHGATPVGSQRPAAAAQSPRPPAPPSHLPPASSAWSSLEAHTQGCG